MKLPQHSLSPEEPKEEDDGGGLRGVKEEAGDAGGEESEDQGKRLHTKENASDK